MAGKVTKGDKVHWKWGNSRAEGKVEKTSTSKTTISSKGSQITRNGEKGNKAIVIKQKDARILKKESELQQ